MLIPFIRTIILYLLIIASLRFMGKRQVGEMQPSELVVTILISAVASVPIQDVGVPLAHGAVPILTLIAAEVIIPAIALKSPRFRKLVMGSPITVIKNGKLDRNALTRLRYSIDDVFEDLRLKDVFDLRRVKLAQVETNGKMSVLIDERDSPATPRQLGLKPPSGEILHVVIADGKISDQGLGALGKSREWAQKTAHANGARSVREVFLLCADANGSIVFFKKEKP